MNTIKPKLSQRFKKCSRPWSVLATAAAATVVPAVVYASFQPLEFDPTLPPETASNETTPLNPYPIVGRSRQVYEDASTGNIPGAVYGVIGILGELGILNPASHSEKVATDSQLPSPAPHQGTILPPQGSHPNQPAPPQPPNSNLPVSVGGNGNSSHTNTYAGPQSPEQVYNLGRYLSALRSQVTQNMSQIVFGVEGQEMIADQSTELGFALSASTDAVQAIQTTLDDSLQISQDNQTHAQNATDEAASAQSAKASQDVLKAVAAQNDDIAKIASNSSTQLAQLTQAMHLQSAQTDAGNAMIGALNNKTETLQVLSASQNFLMSKIDSSLDSDLYYQQVQDSVRQNSSYRASEVIYIPGL